MILRTTLYAKKILYVNLATQSISANKKQCNFIVNLLVNLVQLHVRDVYNQRSCKVTSLLGALMF